MSLHKFAEQVASQGRGDDSLLVHMTPDEVQRLQAFAEANGRSLTINPTTGLPEAGFLSDLFKAVAPIALGAFLGPAGFGLSSMMAGVATGGITALATGSLSRGLMAGLGAYGGAGLADSFMNAGTSALGGAGAEAALQAPSVDAFVGNAEGMTSGDAFNNFLKSDANPAVMGKTDVFGAGVKSAMTDPLGFAKNNLGNLAYAAAPIMAGAMVPTTTQLPDPKSTGNIRQMTFNINPDTGRPDPLYGIREMPIVKASDFGDKTFQGQRDLFYQQNPNPYQLGVGSLNQPPQQPARMNTGGIVALADGGDVVRMAGGTPPKMLTDEQLYQQTGDWNKAAALRDAQNNALNAYNWNQQQQAKVPELINQSMNNATSTQNALLAAKDYVTTAATPTTTTEQFVSGAQAKNIGLTQELQTALANSGLSAAAQYALTHSNIGPAVNKEETYGGLKGLSSNINYLSGQAQDQISKGTLTGQQARENALTEMNKYGINDADIFRATGKTLKELFPDTVVSTCPAPDMRILLANGSLKAAGDLQIGDVIRTQHETTLAWGDHPVTHVSIVPDVPRLKIKFGDVEFVCSLDHKFFKAVGEWITAKDVVLGDMLSGHTVRSLAQADVGNVVRITVDDAHTYICEGLLSHNKSPLGPVVTPPPDPFVSVTPGEVKLPTATTYTNGAFGNYGSGNVTGVDSNGKTVSIATPGDIITNPDGTRTVVPNVPGRPYGGFTGMEGVRSAYTAGGGSLGYTAKAPKTIDEFNKLYNKQTGDSLAAYDYLMGKGGGKYPVKSGVPRISENYADFVMGRKRAKPGATTTDKVTTVVGVPGQPQTFFDEKAYLAANPSVAEELRTGKSVSGQPVLFTSGYDHWLKYGKAQGWPFAGDYAGYTTAAALADAANAGGGGGGGPGSTSGATTAASTVSDSNTANSITGLAAPANNSISVSDAVASPSDSAAATAADGAVGIGGTGDASGPGSGGGGDGDGDGGVGDARGGYYSRGKLHYGAKNMAMGGYAMGGGLGSLGSYSDGGRLLRGPGDGVSDSIPATIGRKQQPARLADGEFVIPARIVSELGNGSTDAGAKKLYAMMDRVQRARGKTTGKNKVAANSRSDKYLPA